MWKTGMRLMVALGLGALAQALPQAGGAQSPQFRGSAAHTGWVETRGVERLGGVAWRFQTGGSVRSSPALEGGVLYVGSADGGLYALDEETGDLRWRYDAGAPIASSPAVWEGVVLIGTRDGTLHGVSVDSGRPLWQVDGGEDRPLPWGHEGWDYIQSSPTLSQGTAYWGTGDGRLLALDPASGDLRWAFRVEARVRSTAAVSGDLLVFGDSDGYVYGLDAGTGALRWRFETEGVGLNSADFGYDRRQISASPAMSGSEIFVGSRDATLYALNAADGSVRWRFSEGSAWVIASNAVTDSRVFSTRSSSGNVRALDRATGREVWRYEAEAFVYSSPVVVGGTLYVGEGDGDFAAHSVETGEVLWSYDVGAPVYSSPAVHDGRVFFGSDDGGVYALAAAESLPWRRAVFFDHDVASLSAFGAAPAHASARDFFTGRGYELLDAPGLEAFLRERIADGAPSVVVFAIDGLPSGMASSETGTPLMRRYLDAGGKVVWMGYPPGYIVRDESGSVVGTDRGIPGALLDLDFSAFDGDEYSVAPTPTGRMWGLESWWHGLGHVSPGEVTQVLALDSTGRAASWVKNFGGPWGTGFVQVRPVTSSDHLAQIQRVAEYGLVRPRSGG